MKLGIKMYDDIIESINEQVENDEISPFEAGFMQGEEDGKEYEQEEE